MILKSEQIIQIISNFENRYGNEGTLTEQPVMIIFRLCQMLMVMMKGENVHVLYNCCGGGIF